MIVWALWLPQSLVKIYAPQQVVDFISRMHGAPGAAVDVAADAASSAAAAAASVGRSAAEAVAGSTGATFDDLHNQAQVRPLACWRS